MPVIITYTLMPVAVTVSMWPWMRGGQWHGGCEGSGVMVVHTMCVDLGEQAGAPTLLANH
jgi:hypothetical protein